MTPRPFSDIAYNQYLNEEKLMGCKCRNCGERYVPPRPLCVKCFSPDLEWVQMKGAGKLAASIASGLTFPESWSWTRAAGWTRASREWTH